MSHLGEGIQGQSWAPAFTSMVLQTAGARELKSRRVFRAGTQNPPHVLPSRDRIKGAWRTLRLNKCSHHCLTAVTEGPMRQTVGAKIHARADDTGKLVHASPPEVNEHFQDTDKERILLELDQASKILNAFLAHSHGFCVIRMYAPSGLGHRQFLMFLPLAGPVQIQRSPSCTLRWCLWAIPKPNSHVRPSW